jgi:phage terminase large subunit
MPEPTKEQVRAWQHYRESSAAFAHDILRMDPDPWQLEAFAAADKAARLDDGGEVDVHSCHGVGKSATDACIALWFYVTTPGSRVVTTAPTEQQLKDLLWTEIRSWASKSSIKDALTIQSTFLCVKGRDPRSYMSGFVSNRMENVEGAHADHILLLRDEAKGIKPDIWDAMEGALTGKAWQLNTSTPGGQAGPFWKRCAAGTSERRTVIHVDGEDPSRVNHGAGRPTWRWIEQRRELWGVDSPIYIARVRGRFPEEGENATFPLSALERAVERHEAGDWERGTPGLGADIARYGDNETCLVATDGWGVAEVEAYNQMSLDATATRAADMWDRRGKLATWWVDDTGVGGGFTDMLRLLGVPVNAVIFGSPASDPYFFNRKTELLWRVRTGLLADKLALPNDAVLLAQLGSIRHGPTPTGVRIIDHKLPSMVSGQKRVDSPDRAHSLALALGEHAAGGLGMQIFAPDTRGAEAETVEARESDREPALITAERQRELDELDAREVWNREEAWRTG